MTCSSKQVGRPEFGYRSSCPGGTNENSPALQRWGHVQKIFKSRRDDRPSLCASLHTFSACFEFFCGTIKLSPSFPLFPFVKSCSSMVGILLLPCFCPMPFPAFRGPGVGSFSPAESAFTCSRFIGVSAHQRFNRFIPFRVFGVFRGTIFLAPSFPLFPFVKFWFVRAYHFVAQCQTTH